MSMDVATLFARISANDAGAVTKALAEAPALAAARDAYLGSTPLHFAAHRGFIEIVRALVDAGADIHAREAASDTTPLHWAAEGGHPAVARLLLERGADLEAIDAWHVLSPLGWTMLVTWAPQYHEDKPATSAFLLSAGARLDVFTAGVRGEGEVLRRILERDAAELRRRLGFVREAMTPLHFAASERLREMTVILLEYGADVHARTLRGLTPLALAIEQHDEPGAAMLREHGAADEVSSALLAGDLHALEHRLADAEPDLVTRLLFAAASRGQAGAVRLLVGAGARHEARLPQLVGEIPSCVTPLHAAAAAGHEDVVRVLLEAGAAVNEGSDEGRPTPLHVAAGGGDLPTVRTLLAYGADASGRDRAFGATPAEWAGFDGHADIVALLKEAETRRSGG